MQNNYIYIYSKIIQSYNVVSPFLLIALLVIFYFEQSVGKVAPWQICYANDHY